MSELKGNKVIVSKETFEVYNCFFQYGNYEGARVVFVGREEGLDRQMLKIIMQVGKLGLRTYQKAYIILME